MNCTPDVDGAETATSTWRKVREPRGGCRQKSPGLCFDDRQASDRAGKLAKAMGLQYRKRMKSEQLAKAVAASLARHQTRGLVDEAAGMADVVIHGRVDLLSVAEDLQASMLQLKPARRSWAVWFVGEVEHRRQSRRLDRQRERLTEQIDCGSNTAEIALSRLRLREASPGRGSFERQGRVDED